MQTDPVLDEAKEAERESIIKQKRVLRRYLRLKRNNFVKTHEDILTDKYYIQSYMPKIESILQDNMEFLSSIQKGDSRIQISSYNPLKAEMNITPVIAELLRTTKLPLCHSLPRVVDLNDSLEFKVY